MCISSLRTTLVGAEVRVLSSANFRDYTTISPFLLENLARGEISLTHFSDVLRMTVLREHGGIWIDATVMVLAELPGSVFDTALYTRKGAPSEDCAIVSDRRWSTWLLGGPAQSEIFCFAADFLEEYWRRHDEVLHYFLLDYILALAYKSKISGFARAIDAIPTNNEHAYELRPLLRAPFNAEALERLRVSDTYFYKLDWRDSFPASDETTLTLYDYLQTDMRSE